MVEAGGHAKAVQLFHAATEAPMEALDRPGKLGRDKAGAASRFYLGVTGRPRQFAGSNG
jgi:hypothetical protein